MAQRVKPCAFVRGHDARDFLFQHACVGIAPQQESGRDLLRANRAKPALAHFIECEIKARQRSHIVFSRNFQDGLRGRIEALGPAVAEPAGRAERDRCRHGDPCQREYDFARNARVLAAEGPLDIAVHQGRRRKRQRDERRLCHHASASKVS